jgi:hypothetical protein
MNANLPRVLPLLTYALLTDRAVILPQDDLGLCLTRRARDWPDPFPRTCVLDPPLPLTCWVSLGRYFLPRWPQFFPLYAVGSSAVVSR